jgi:beta-glucuronidase
MIFLEVEMRAYLLWFLLPVAMLASPAVAATFTLSDPGTEKMIDYEKYGRFEGIGTENYKYQITSSSGLKAAAGEGVFPNTTSILRDPAYKKFKKAGVLNGTQWNFVNSDNFQANFYKWATCSEDPGVKQYYAAFALEQAGNIEQAIKGYHAVVVNFPKTVGYTYWKTPWYIGQVAIDKIQYLTRQNPQLGMRLVDASIRIKNKYDDDKKNDVFIVNPGRLVTAQPGDFAVPKTDLRGLEKVKSIGKGNVQLVQYSNRHWQLLVDGTPFVIHGMAYSPNKVGLSPDNGTLNVSRDWMFADYDKNGKIDGPYDAWVDKDRNNRQPPDVQAVGDFSLMKDMGVNTLRVYHYTGLNKELLMEGYKNYGFMYLMGNMLGMYATDSGAEWFSGTDYTDPVQQQHMLDSVRKMVEEYRDQPYILMWVLGNENNYGEPGKQGGKQGKDKGQGCRAKLQPEVYYRFVNEAAKLVKSLDPLQRPVAVCNGDTLFLDICAADAPAVDVFGANAYRGEQGFGSLWEDVSEVYDRPVLVTEYGCSAYHRGWNVPRAEEGQARYHRGNWLDIDDNTAGAGVGNALGGVVFEWTDEWWKAGQPAQFSPDHQDTVPQFGAPFLDGWSYEEWLGITSQGDGTHSPFLRQLRPVYFVYKELWGNSR